MPLRDWLRTLPPALAGVVAGILLGAALASPRPVTLQLNGRQASPTAPSRLVGGQPMVPAGWVAEVWGADVEWEAKTRTLNIRDGGVASLRRQLDLLQRAIAPRTARDAVCAWAEGVKTRNGALQFAVMSPELQEKSRTGLAEADWTAGLSSPWVESFLITRVEEPNPDGTQDFRVEFHVVPSPGNPRIEVWRTTTEKTLVEEKECWRLKAVHLLGTGSLLDAWQPVLLPELGVSLRIPPDWSARWVDRELRWIDRAGRELGGIYVLGGLYLPNHSLTRSEEAVGSGLGEAKLFVLERSHPAASGRKETWIEVHGFVPTGSGDRWLDLWLKPLPAEDVARIKETMRSLLEQIESRPSSPSRSST